MSEDNTTKSALQEKDGVNRPNSINIDKVKALKIKKKPNIDPKVLSDRIIHGDIVALSQAITIIESTASKHLNLAKEILQNCLAANKPSIRIGITGVPGVGKSTFIESFGTLLTSKGYKVAVLAVDPSSSITKGSILGDKTRMESLSKNPNAIIRPSPAGESLGGVARKTRETIILCEAAGFTHILVETVGVGQSETMVHSMTDFFLLLKLAGAGDELQGIKRGIMEMADLILINKADGDNEVPARRAKAEFNRALHLYPEKKSGWKPTTLTCSSLHNVRIDKVWEKIEEYQILTKENKSFETKRKEQNRFWLMQTIEDQLKQRFYANPKVNQALKEKVKEVEDQQLTPFEAAQYLLDLDENAL